MHRRGEQWQIRADVAVLLGREVERRAFAPEAQRGDVVYSGGSLFIVEPAKVHLLATRPSNLALKLGVRVPQLHSIARRSQYEQERCNIPMRLTCSTTHVCFEALREAVTRHLCVSGYEGAMQYEKGKGYAENAFLRYRTPLKDEVRAPREVLCRWLCEHSVGLSEGTLGV